MRQEKNGGKSNGFGEDVSNKRYMILTYETNFEETHYPLPLNYQGKENQNGLIDYHSIHNSTEISNRGVSPVSINQENIIQKQREQLNQFEDKLRKRNKTLKDLRSKIETLENEKRLLEIKNR